jgi:hypothetical protein
MKTNQMTYRILNGLQDVMQLHGILKNAMMGNLIQTMVTDMGLM